MHIFIFPLRKNLTIDLYKETMEIKDVGRNVSFMHYIKAFSVTEPLKL